MYTNKNVNRNSYRLQKSKNYIILSLHTYFTYKFIGINILFFNNFCVKHSHKYVKSSNLK